MIELTDCEKPSHPSITGRSTRRVVYRAISEIPALLRGKRQAQVKTTYVDVLATDSRPLCQPPDSLSEVLESILSTEPHINEETDQLTAGDEVEVAAPEHIDLGHAVTSSNERKSEPFEEKAIYTEEDYAKVRKALVIYRRTHPNDLALRKRSFSRRALFLSAQFKAFLNQVRHLDFASHPFYRKIYLWSCPHLTSVLHDICDALLAKRAGLKKKTIAKGEHLKYEQLMADTTELK